MSTRQLRPFRCQRHLDVDAQGMVSNCGFGDCWWNACRRCIIDEYRAGAKLDGAAQMIVILEADNQNAGVP